MPTMSVSLSRRLFDFLDDIADALELPLSKVTERCVEFAFDRLDEVFPELEEEEESEGESEDEEESEEDEDED